jgi:hypothetical protein
MEEITATVRPVYLDEDVKREPHVLRELGALDDQLERLSSAIDDVSRRLGPVLNMGPVPGTIRPEGDEESLAPYAERIRNQRRLVEGNVDRLRELLDRLEV